MTQAQPQTEHFTSPSTGDLTVIVLPPDQRNTLIDAAIRRHLESSIAQSRGTMTVDNAFDLLDKDLIQAFLMIENREIVAVALTKVVDWGTGKRSLIVLQGGGLGTLVRGLDPIMSKMEEFAIAAGCSSLRVEGRKGWGRVLPDEYEFSHSVFEKELR